MFVAYILRFKAIDRRGIFTFVRYAATVRYGRKQMFGRKKRNRPEEDGFPEDFPETYGLTDGTETYKPIRGTREPGQTEEDPPVITREGRQPEE